MKSRAVKALLSVAIGVSVLVAAWSFWQQFREPEAWSEREKAILETLWIDKLPPPPADPSNAVADDPRAARFGRQLFFDTRLSRNGEVNCATCHQPELDFTDGLPTARALGQSPRNTPTIVGTAYSPWFYWDGRKDSHWAQALSPLEDPAEHGGNRMAFVRLIQQDADYRRHYEALFGALPDFTDERFPRQAAPKGTEAWRQAWQGMPEEDRETVNRVFANIGKAIAAYERTLMPGESRFDRYVEAVLADEEARARELFSTSEIRGLRLFIDEGRCLECHNGPLFTNNEFHNTGLMPPPGELPDHGRSAVLDQLREDPFNCLGPYSDAEPGQCRELNYMRDNEELIGAMKTPTLRDLEATAPYMHKGQLQSLEAVLDHYNRAELALIGHNEAEPLGLNGWQLDALESFLRTLNTRPGSIDQQWREAPSAGASNKNAGEEPAP